MHYIQDVIKKKRKRILRNKKKDSRNENSLEGLKDKGNTQKTFSVKIKKFNKGVKSEGKDKNRRSVQKVQFWKTEVPEKESKGHVGEEVVASCKKIPKNIRMLLVSRLKGLSTQHRE